MLKQGKVFAGKMTRTIDRAGIFPNHPALVHTDNFSIPFCLTLDFRTQSFLLYFSTYSQPFGGLLGKHVNICMCLPPKCASPTLNLPV